MIKLVLGSRVMNEGISLKNVGEVYILDVYFNLGRVDQVVGRAIRWCSHHQIMSVENQFPEVNVYKFVVSLDGELSSEEKMYKRAEIKYILVKEVERLMKEVSIDCPLNHNGNMFADEIEKYKNCEKEKNCPAICDYTSCSYKCNDTMLNAEYYDPSNGVYKKIRLDKLDKTTFNNTLARNEIDYAKEKIKEMYNIGGFMFMLSDILNYVKESYNEDKKELFSDFFVYKGLYEMTPTTENDFNNFKDTVVDKFNKTGYLIYINKWYIFQPFDENENIPMYYRTTNFKHLKNIKNQVSLYSYLKNSKYNEYTDLNDEINSISQKENIVTYDFESTMEYYDSREEYQYVGFIDKELNRKKNKITEEVNDIFKLREKRAKILEKKRGTGIPSLKGAVCSTSKDKKYLVKVATKLGINLKNVDIRGKLCKSIENRMLFLEKYSTEKNGNKYTYVMIPYNHQKYNFPYNLEDRVQYIVDKLNNSIKFKIIYSVKNKKEIVEGENVLTYILTINHDDKLNEYLELLKSYGAIKKNNEWTIDIK